MDIYRFTQVELLSFALIMIRVSAFLVSWPVFGSAVVPAPVKILFAVLITFILYPVVGHKVFTADILNEKIVFLAGREALVGVAIGYFTRIFFLAVSMAGNLVSTSMGLSTAQVLNPMLAENSTSMEQFLTILATLFFLTINGHQIFIMSFVQSFEVVPLTQDALTFAGFANMGKMVETLLVIAIQLSAPVLISLLFMNMAMAIVGRAVPQINVLVTSLPVNILVGFFVLSISIPFFVWQMRHLLEETTVQVFTLMKGF